MRTVSGGIEGRWRGDHIMVIVKAAAGYIQDEQTQQPKPQTVRFVVRGLLKGLFMCVPGTKSALSRLIRQPKKMPHKKFMGLEMAHVDAISSRDFFCFLRNLDRRV